MVEQFSQILEEYWRKVVDEQQKDWDEHILRFVLAYLSAMYDSTSRSPAKAKYGKKDNEPIRDDQA